jgi:hypothetical protein
MTHHEGHGGKRRVIDRNFSGLRVLRVLRGESGFCAS